MVVAHAAFDCLSELFHSNESLKRVVKLTGRFAMGIGPSVRIDDKPNSTAVDPSTVVKENPDLFKPDGYEVARVLEEVKAKDPSLFGDGSENLAALTEYLKQRDAADGSLDGRATQSPGSSTARTMATDFLGSDYDGSLGSATPAGIQAAEQALLDKGYVFVGYHGSSAAGSQNILTQGIKEQVNQELPPEWRGFYVADDPNVAAAYAINPDVGAEKGSQLMRVYLPKEQAEKLQSLGTPLDQTHQALLEFENATGIKAGTPGAEYLMRGLEATGGSSSETIMSWSLADKAVVLPSSITPPQGFREMGQPLKIPDWEQQSPPVVGQPINQAALEAASKGERLASPSNDTPAADGSGDTSGTLQTKLPQGLSADASGQVTITDGTVVGRLNDQGQLQLNNGLTVNEEGTASGTEQTVGQFEMRDGKPVVVSADGTLIDVDGNAFRGTMAQPIGIIREDGRVVLRNGLVKGSDGNVYLESEGTRRLIGPMKENGLIQIPDLSGQWVTLDGQVLTADFKVYGGWDPKTGAVTTQFGFTVGLPEGGQAKLTLNGAEIGSMDLGSGKMTFNGGFTADPDNPALLDANGTQIGILQTDGTARLGDGSLWALPKIDGTPLGDSGFRRMADGTILNPDGTTFGKLSSDTAATDVGGYIVDSQGNKVAFLDKNGQVLGCSEDGKMAGYRDSQGNLWTAPDANGQRTKIGTINGEGGFDFIDPTTGKLVGTLSRQGVATGTDFLGKFRLGVEADMSMGRMGAAGAILGMLVSVGMSYLPESDAVTAITAVATILDPVSWPMMLPTVISALKDAQAHYEQRLAQAGAICGEAQKIIDEYQFQPEYGYPVGVYFQWEVPMVQPLIYGLEALRIEAEKAGDAELVTKYRHQVNILSRYPGAYAEGDALMNSD